MIPLMIVLIVLGLFLAVAAIMNWEAIYAICEIEIISAFLGEGMGRVICLIVGCLMVAAGIAGLVMRN